MTAVTISDRWLVPDNRAYLIADDDAPVLAPERRAVLVEAAAGLNAAADLVVGSVALPAPVGELVSCAVWASGSSLWVVDERYGPCLTQAGVTVRVRRPGHVLTGATRFQLSPLFAVTSDGVAVAVVMPIRPTATAADKVLARRELAGTDSPAASDPGDHR